MDHTDASARAGSAGRAKAGRKPVALAAALCLLAAGCSSTDPLASRAWRIEPMLEVRHSTAGADAHYAMGRYYGGMQLWDKAIKAYAQAVVADPRHMEAHNALGAALARLGRHAEAEQALRRAVALGPEEAHLRSNLGYALLLADRPREALAELKIALKLAPHDLVARGNLRAAASRWQDLQALQPQAALASAAVGETVVGQPAEQAAAVPVAGDPVGAVVAELPGSAQAAPQAALHEGSQAVPQAALQEASQHAEPMRAAPKEGQPVHAEASPPVAAPAAAPVAVVMADSVGAPALVVHTAPAVSLQLQLEWQTSATALAPSLQVIDQPTVAAWRVSGTAAPDQNVAQATFSDALESEAASEAESEAAPSSAALVAFMPAAPGAAGTEAAPALEPAREAMLAHAQFLPHAANVRDAVLVSDAVTLPEPMAATAARMRLELSNGMGARGMAARLGQWLGLQGLPASRLTNQRPYTQQRTVVEYRAGHEANARSVAQALPTMLGVRFVQRAGLASDVRVVLGRDWQSVAGCLAARDHCGTANTLLAARRP